MRDVSKACWFVGKRCAQGVGDEAIRTYQGGIFLDLEPVGRNGGIHLDRHDPEWHHFRLDHEDYVDGLA